MARQRLQVDPSVSAVGLRPTASPVDQFVQVNPNGPTAQLARALSEFAPQLGQVLTTYADQRNADARREGERLALRLHEQRKTYAQAVKEGLIPRSANPFFYAGVKEQFGRVAAETMASDILAAVQEDERMRKTTDIREYDEFVQQRVAEWLDQNVTQDLRDEFFDAGYAEHAQRLLAGQRTAFASQIGARIEKLGDEALYAEVARRVGDLSPENVSEVTAYVQQLADDLIQHQGRSGEQVMRTIAQAIADTAVTVAGEDRDDAFAVLDLMKSIRGREGALFNTSYGKQLYNTTLKEVIRESNYRRAQERQEREWEQEDRAMELQKRAMQLLVENPNADLTQILRDAQDVPGAVGVLRSLQENVTGLARRDDGSVVDNLVRRILKPDGNPVTTATITRSLANGDLTAQTAVWLQNLLEERIRASRGQIDDIFRDFYFQREMYAMNNRLKDLLPDEISDKGQRLVNAELELMQWWRSYLQGSGANKSPDERELDLNAQAAAIANKWRGAVATLIMGGENGLQPFEHVGPVDPSRQQRPQDTPSRQAHPIFTRDQTNRILREIRSGRYSNETLRFMRQRGWSKQQLRQHAIDAGRYYANQSQ